MQPYNLFKVYGVSFACSPILFLLGKFGDTFNLQTFSSICQTLSWVCPLGSLGMILIIVGICRLKGQTFHELFLSLKATFLIRRYCHSESSDSFVTADGKMINPRNRITRKANRSLLSLDIIVKNDTAELTWWLPLNHESKELLVKMFPNIRAELNQILPTYVFSDITNDKGNRYLARAHKN